MAMANATELGSPGGLGDELRQDAAKLSDVASERLSSEAEVHKGEIASQARSVSNALEKAAGELGGQDTSDWLRSSLRQGADTLQRLADSVENKNVRELLDDLNALGREHPGAFLGACALAGFAVARVFKAGSAGAGSHNSLGLMSGQGSASASSVSVSQAGARPAAQRGGQAAHRSSQPYSDETATADEAMAAAISLGAQ